MIDLYNGDCVDVLQKIDKTNAIIVTDPPFNVGYKYATYKDRMETDKYPPLKNSGGGYLALYNSVSATYNVYITNNFR